uniref:C-type lectin domain-containing protein n=1 Tax=Spermophilus dauricus TaxID=99837 RepID=A0A8C9UPQ0_SPEDA
MSIYFIFQIIIQCHFIYLVILTLTTGWSFCWLLIRVLMWSPLVLNFNNKHTLKIDFLMLHLYFLLPNKGKVWSCCPKNWKSFSSSCYFISSKQRSWKESQENCSTMEAHLVVINSKEEQDFLTWNLNKSHDYFVGLSDPKGQRHWQWIDQTPYNQNTTFWHPGEPNRVQERCVVLNYREQWGWNDIFCAHVQSSICEMMKIYL